VGIKLLFIRHGESRGNLSQRWQGWLDEPLTDLGREQAQRLAERLQRWAIAQSQPIEVVYSSTLSRAFQTASVLAQSWRVPLVLDSRLRERDVGVMQGLTWPEIEVRYPDIAQIIRQRWVVPALPEGETTFDLAERAWQAVEEIITRADDRDAGSIIAIVSHGGTINAYLNRLVGRHHDMPFMFHLGNTSLSMIELHGGRPRILLVNDLCHLD
jgi:broad specificity phosphatase PhoE